MLIPLLLSPSLCPLPLPLPPAVALCVSVGGRRPAVGRRTRRADPISSTPSICRGRTNDEPCWPCPRRFTAKRVIYWRYWSTALVRLQPGLARRDTAGPARKAPCGDASVHRRAPTLSIELQQALQRLPVVTNDHQRAPVFTSGRRLSLAVHWGSPVIASFHWPSPAITSDHQRSPAVTSDHRRSPAVTGGHRSRQRCAVAAAAPCPPVRETAPFCRRRAASDCRDFSDRLPAHPRFALTALFASSVAPAKEATGARRPAELMTILIHDTL